MEFSAVECGGVSDSWDGFKRGLDKLMDMEEGCVSVSG